jgi:hypothetical protein
VIRAWFLLLTLDTDGHCGTTASMKKIEMIRAAVSGAKDAELTIVALQSGWPSVVRHSSIAGGTDFAVHIAPAGDFHRNPNEMRFQNPGQNCPVKDDQGFPILLGIDQTLEPTVLIAADAVGRLGRETRFSVRFEKDMIPKARNEGVATFSSGTGEVITAFRVEYLPSFLAAAIENVQLPASRMKDVTNASGLHEENSQAAADRARRAASVLIRDQSFGGKVRAAYDQKCALCGLSAGLTVGAHIYPASAPASPYVNSNGVCLCENHHRAYDAFLIWFDADTLAVKVHPDVIAAAETDIPLKLFLDATYSVLTPPGDPADRPSPEMITLRHKCFENEYQWLDV